MAGDAVAIKATGTVLPPDLLFNLCGGSISHLKSEKIRLKAAAFHLDALHVEK